MAIKIIEELGNNLIRIHSDLDGFCIRNGNNISQRVYKETIINKNDFNKYVEVSADLTDGCIETSAYLNSNIEYAICPNKETIGLSSFYNCSCMTEVNIEQAQTIKSFAFANCSSLTSIYMKNVKNIEDFAFDNCSALKNLNILNVESIGKCAFNNCSSFTNINMLSATVLTGNFSDNLSNFSKLSEINLPNCIKVNNICFENNTAIQQFNAPKLKYISNSNTFANCSNLTTVKLNSCVEITGGNTFANNSKLRTMYLPALQEFKDDNAGNNFAKNCISLQNINLSCCKNLGDDAFSGCTSLTCLNISSQQKINKNFVKDCNNLISLNIDNATIIKSGAFSGCYKLTELSCNNVVKIYGEESIFKDCRSLRYIHYENYNKDEIPYIDDAKKHFDKLTNFTILVPRSKLMAWRSAPNWNCISKFISSID